MFAARRLTGLLGVALAVTLAGQTASAEAASRTSRREVAAQVRVATYNAAAFVAHARAAADVTRLAGAADVVTLQEMSSAERRKMVRAALIDCATCVYQGYMPREAVQGGTPILYREDKFTFVTAGTTQVSEATYVGARGAGPSTLRAKYINWVHLRERTTQRDVYVLNNHAVPTVQGPGGGPNTSMPKRLELHRLHMAGITELTTHFQMTGALVFVTGDLNVNFRTDRRAAYRWFPFMVMRGVGLRASYDALGQPAIGTHGSGDRLIDYVHASVLPWATAVRQEVLRMRPPDASIAATTSSTGR
jgi:hypothetical protein